MRLFEAILDANHRAIAGDTGASIHCSQHEDSLPVAALTCIDVRLNRLLPAVLGLPEDQFIWLRNAGNIITGPMSSTLRSISLACAVKGAREICVIGHTDCQVGRCTTMILLERMAALGVDRAQLPENLIEFFGMFSSERQNIIKAVDFIRNSPLIGRKIPVHGLLVEIESGKLEWVVNGYETFASSASPDLNVLGKAGQFIDKLEEIGKNAMGGMKFPETKIGEGLQTAENWLHKVEEAAALLKNPPHPPAPPSAEPPLPPQLPARKKAPPQPVFPVKFNVRFNQPKPRR
jgi:carbonic anhydrase